MSGGSLLEREKGVKKMMTEEIAMLAVEFILTRNMEELANLKDIQIAQGIGVDIFDLSSCFEADRQMAISEFILREKIYRAYFILRKDARISIKKLSNELGFTKLADFNSVFERYFAISPKNYQNLDHKNPSCLEKGDVSSPAMK